MNKLAVRISFLTAMLVWAVFIAIAMSLHHKQGLWFLALGWPVLYAFFYALLLCCTAYGPDTAIIPERLRPAFIRSYFFGMQATLVAFPVVALAVAVLVFII